MHSKGKKFLKINEVTSRCCRQREREREREEKRGRRRERKIIEQMSNLAGLTFFGIRYAHVTAGVRLNQQLPAPPLRRRQRGGERGREEGCLCIDTDIYIHSVYTRLLGRLRRAW